MITMNHPPKKAKLNIQLSFRTGLILLTFVISLPGLLMIVYQGFTDHRSANERAQESAFQLTQLVAEEYELVLRSSRHLLSALSIVPEIQADETEQCSSIMSAILEDNPQYGNLAVLNLDGDIICSGTPLAEPVSLADRPWFQEVLQSRKFTIGEYQISRVTKDPVIVLSMPVMDENENFVKVVYLTIDLSWLGSVVPRIDLPPDSSVMVIDRNGMVLSRYPEPEKWVGKLLPEEPVVQTMIEQRSGWVETTGIDGIERLYTYKPLYHEENRENGYLTIGFSTAQVYSEARRELARNLLGLASVTALAIWFGLIGGRYLFTDGLNRIMSATRRLAAGDWSARTHFPYSKNEIHQLGNMFDEMALALQIQAESNRQAQAAITESEQRFRLLADHAVDMIYRVSFIPDRHYEYVSPSVVNFVGYSAEELYANPDMVYQWTYPEDKSIVAAKIEGPNPKSEIFSLRWIHREGHIVWVEIRNVPIYNEDGQLQAMEGIVRDVTEREETAIILERRVVELETLHRIAVIALQADSIDQLIARTTEVIGEVLFPKNFGVLMVDWEHQLLRAHPSYRSKKNLPVKEIQLNQGIAGRVVRSGKPVLLSDTSEEQDYFSIDPSTRSEICVPIQLHGVVIGAINTESDVVGFFTGQDLRLVSTVADQMAASFEKLLLNQELRKQLDRLTALRKIDLAISENMDIGETLKVLVDEVTNTLNFDAVDVLLYYPAERVLRRAGSIGFNPDQLHKHSEIAIDSIENTGLASVRALTAGRTIHIPDISKNPSSRARLISQEGFSSVYVVPLIAKGQTHGLLEVFSRAPLELSSDRISFLEALAGQATIAIENSTLLKNLEQSNRELVEAYNETISGWSRALELRDQETEGHSQRVTEWTLRLAMRMGLRNDRLNAVERGALLHDIGKMGIPDHILLKPGQLTEQEWEIMKMHPIYAYQLLKSIPFLAPSLDIPFAHHERWNGSGYPRGLSGEEIPLAARIFTVVDVWDALCSDRPYRTAWEHERVKEYLLTNAGVLFDPRVVNEFLQMMEEDSVKNP